MAPTTKASTAACVSSWTAGTEVANYKTDFCPNYYQSTRTRRDAPAENPYPQGCSYNPFTIGSVWGIQAGWNAATETWESAQVPGVGASERVAPDATLTSAD